MKTQIYVLLLTISLFSKILQVSAQPAIILSDTGSLKHIGKLIDIYEDKSGCLKLEEILLPEYQSKFKRSERDVPNLGSTKSALWCRFALQKKAGSQWFIRMDNAYLDTFQLFVQTGSGFKKKESGRDYSYTAREIKSVNIIFPLNLPKDSLTYVYVRAKHYIIHVPLEIGQITPMLNAEGEYNFYYGIFFGIVGIMLIMNLIMYFSMRDISLIYYIFYTACFGLYTFITKGYESQLLPDSFLWLNPYAPLAIYANGFFVPLFGITFLKAKETSPLFYKICIGFVIYMVITILIYLFGMPALASQSIVIWSIIVALLNLVFGIIIYKNGYKPARFFAIAYSFTILSFIAFTLETNGIISSNFFSQNSLQFSTIWEIIFFTVAIGDKANILRIEKEKAQQEVIKSVMENELILQNQNVILEQKVNDRTHELEIEKIKSEDLLLNILPAEVAEEIKKNGHSKAKTFSMVTVMFTDFKDFTLVSEKVSAELLVAEIDYCFSAFDKIIQNYNIEKIKTSGDAYICVGGLPNLTLTHAADIVNAAIEIRNFIGDRKKEKESKEEIAFEIRIGIHTGPVVAGVVGLKKFAYDIWGDTVNLASRMESLSDAGKINISGSTYKLVKERFSCHYRGQIEAKNKGMVDMYFVEASNV